jgi:release factor glutamine methyltransferase
MLLLCPPGVYQAQGDTALLVESIEREQLAPGSRVLDIGTGSGALAVAAACHGASVTAVDVSRWALATALCNGLLHGRLIDVRHGDLLAPVRGDLFDMIVSNPPYVPAAARSARGAARAWDAGPDGRDFIERICRQAPTVLAPGGVLLLVQSSLSNVPKTYSLLRKRGLRPDIVAAVDQPFGPVMRTRARWFEQRGLIRRGQREEELVVIRAVRD